MRCIIQPMLVVSYGWILFYVLWGGTASGKAWFSALSRTWFEDYKAGVLFLVLILPILSSGIIASLCLTSVPEGEERAVCRQKQRRLPHGLARFIGRFASVSHNGDPDFDKMAFAWILVPSLIFLAGNIHRHLFRKELDAFDTIMEVGNSFGVVALVAMAGLFVPVARFSCVLQCLGWGWVHAIRLHVWLGRIVVFGSVVHGAMHMYNWTTLEGELWSMILPPRPCWTLSTSTKFQPSCNSSDSDCSCYQLFRNLTGFIAGVFLVLVFLTSLNPIRRMWYTLFFRSHIVAGPLAFVFTILHYNRAILYVLGGLLFYIGSSFVAIYEARTKTDDDGVQIVSVTHLVDQNSSSSKPCVVVRVAAEGASLQQYRCGQAVQLRAPQISNISHPFTINTVPGSPNEMCIIFRVMGKFTRQLAHRFTLSMTEPANKPVLFLNGFYEVPNRVDQVLSHDVCVLVAGGIGITPYLSLLHKVHSIMANPTRLDEYALKTLCLHWVCRDEALVKYVQQAYFEPLLKLVHSSRPRYNLRIVIHRTRNIEGSDGPVHPVASYSDLEPPGEMGDQDEPVGESPGTSASNFCVYEDNDRGCPFKSTVFSAGTKPRILCNWPIAAALSSTTVIGIWTSWLLYSNVQDKHEVLSRIWAPVVLLVAGQLGAMMINGIVPKIGDGSNVIVSEEFESLPSSDEVIELQGLPLDKSSGETTAVAEWEQYPDPESLTAPSERQENPAVVLEEHKGRPTVHTFLHALEESRSPAVFACGPVPLLKEIRKVATERCCHRLERCFKPDTNHVCIYEEAFHL